MEFQQTHPIIGPNFLVTSPTECRVLSGLTGPSTTILYMYICAGRALTIREMGRLGTDHLHWY